MPPVITQTLPIGAGMEGLALRYSPLVTDIGKLTQDGQDGSDGTSHAHQSIHSHVCMGTQFSSEGSTAFNGRDDANVSFQSAVARLTRVVTRAILMMA